MEFDENKLLGIFPLTAEMQSFSDLATMPGTLARIREEDLYRRFLHNLGFFGYEITRDPEEIVELIFKHSLQNSAWAFITSTQSHNYLDVRDAFRFRDMTKMHTTLRDWIVWAHASFCLLSLAIADN